MNKRLKKWIGIVTALAVILTFALGLSGCSSSSTASSSAGKIQEYEVPSDGIIQKSHFEELKGTVNTDVYKGTVDLVTYVWTFNGKDINNPMDFNIALSLNNDAFTQVQQATGSGQIQGFKFADNAGVPGNYNLRLNLSSKWECDSIDLYHLDGTNLNKVGTVYMDNSGDVTKVNFGLTVASGQFYLVSSYQVVDPNSTLGTSGTILTTDEANQLKQNIIDQDSNYSGETDAYGTQLDNSKVLPAAQGDVDADTTKYCTLSIECANVFKAQYYPSLDKEKEPYLPSDGVIMSARQVAYHPGEMVFDVLKRECQNNTIHLEYSYTPMYGSAYIEGICNLYEFDCGELSGWMYSVNGWYPNYGCSRYLIEEGDVIEWHYTCDLGNDLPGGNIY